MKLTLIKPNIGCLEHGRFVDEARMQPLQLGVLAALTPPDVEVVLHDDRIGPPPFDEPTDLVAITVESFTARRAYEISAEYRLRDVPVILGGMHVTLLPQEAARYADSIYTGDAESLWPQVIEDARLRKLRPHYQAPAGPPQPGVLTRRDIFADKGYLPLCLLQFSRGCRFSCEFCAVSAYFDKTQYCRRIDEVVQEIEAQEQRNLFFVDDNLLSDHAAAKMLFRALIPLKINWVSQGSIDMTEDCELMDLMVQSGCLGNVIGFESITPENLRAMNKSPNLAGGSGLYHKSIRILRDYGLQTWAAFTIGYDFDTPDTLEQTLEFALRNKFAFAAFNVLMPYPGTPLYARLRSENRLLYDGSWWLHPDYRFNYAAFRPASMTADELTEAGFHCRAEFNSWSAIAQRAMDFKTNLRTMYRFAIYAIYSRLFRQETFKKHGMKFGLR